jgi:hypothetical protein
MATTIKQSFDTFASNINVTDRQETIVSNCRQNVVSTISKTLTLNDEGDSMLIGSWDRKTAIKPLSEGDVDLMVILHYGENKEWFDNAGGSIKALDKYKEILDTKYPDTQKRRDRNCISMTLSEFKFDVIPAFKDKSGYYWIPDSVNNKWIKTNPIEFAKLITQTNKNMAGDFVPIIKMLKAWNRNNGSLIKGFHLECMLYEHYKLYTKSYTFSSTIRNFFTGFGTKIYSSTYDPVTLDRLDQYLDNQTNPSNRQRLYEKISADTKKANEAMDFENSNNEVSAIVKWKEIFGSYFPSYG